MEVLIVLLVIFVIISVASAVMRQGATSMQGYAENKIKGIAENLRVSGQCPYCASIIKADPPTFDGKAWNHPVGFDCPGCQQRIIVKDGHFTKLPITNH